MIFLLLSYFSELNLDAWYGFYIWPIRSIPFDMQKAGDTCDISPQIFLDFPQILGWEREINTAPKPSPEVAPSKMKVAPF